MNAIQATIRVPLILEIPIEVRTPKRRVTKRPADLLRAIANALCTRKGGVELLLISYGRADVERRLREKGFDDLADFLVSA